MTKGREQIQSIINGIAWKHGISNPDVLEGGSFLPHEGRILRRLGKAALKKQTPESLHKYILQKAKFITGSHTFGK